MGIAFNIFFVGILAIVGMVLLSRSKVKFSFELKLMPFSIKIDIKK